MIPFETLNQQNHEIAELTKVLSTLLQEREMCDTDVVNELFDRYIEKVKEHFELNEKSVYSKLLTHSDAEVNAVANRFLAGEEEIKKLFRSYTNKWCRKGLQIGNHDEFLQETEEMFRLVDARVQAEFEELYPLARNEGLTSSA